MTQHFLGANRGEVEQQPGYVTTGTATGSTDMELRWDDTKNLTQKDVRLFLESLLVFMDSNYVPTAIPPL